MYVAGCFTRASGQEASRIAKWIGTAWEIMTTGVDEAIFAMLLHRAAHYVGGAFTTAGGNKVNGIAKRNTLTSA